MTRVRWSTIASDDLARIVDWIRIDNPDAARRVARTIFEAVEGLRRHPGMGRTGLAPDTRELVFPPWPYIAVYEVVDSVVNVLRIRHASQDWP